MITQELKALAIAKLKHRVPVELIAEELDIPQKLVLEWHGNLDQSDMIAIKSNIHAVEQLTKGELVPLNEDALRKALETTAIDIAKQALLPAVSADMVHAKSVQLCADAISKLYNTFILKGSTGEPTKASDNQNHSIFQQLMKD